MCGNDHNVRNKAYCKMKIFTLKWDIILSVQVIKVHQNTVDTYLEDIIMGSLDNTADTQAREEIRVQADAINDVAYELESR